MKILLVLGKYLPEKSGGIENYSHWLATRLLEKDHKVNAAILHSGKIETYSYEGVTVISLKQGFESFTTLLANGKYDICHFQELSGENGINIKWIKAAGTYCQKIFFTFHLPYLTCYKKDFRYMGIEDCHNFSSAERCVKCIIATRAGYVQSKGNINLRNFIINLITPIAAGSRKIKYLRTRLALRKDTLHTLIANCNEVFIYGKWFKELLMENGYQSAKLKIIPHISKTTTGTTDDTDYSIKKKLLFIGRIEAEKGLHLLCKAMNIISTKHIAVDVFGNKVDDDYLDTCKAIYDFNYKGTVPRSVLLERLKGYDFLVLPSVFTEMFSLSLREAFYEKVPVIVSAAKGNKDVVTEGSNGFIFEYNNYKDLARAIDHAYALKAKGWTPGFVKDNSEEDLARVLSYYS